MEARAQSRIQNLQSETLHVPVLLQETLDWLAIRPGGCYIDGTLGGGGHAAAILSAAQPGGRLLGLDADPAALARARKRLAAFGSQLVAVHGSFDEIELTARAHDLVPADGILLDLGLSSDQLADSARGFSFTALGLDMRFDPSHGQPASSIVNEWPADELASLLYRYGEESASRKIARAIEQARPIHTAQQLAQVVEHVMGRRPVGGGRRIQPATRVFQALRIAVNDELGALERVLPQALRLLRAGGRLAIITFHSLEDRVVKTFFQMESKDCICPPERPACRCHHQAALKIITRKPVTPGTEELRANPRSRSAKLRVAERI
ncbi:MAG: 16S rRNA (cytosine(1402)-N(4))-methyltransferase RsmH [Thermoflexales bacterium]|nr:16S rRNA (cytosine(1402)-N(4))-methyltransferase RsmH [Thermoflexales bacterium]